MVQIKKHNGFSLVEISIVLLVVAVAVSSGVMVFNKYSNESKVSQTQFTMKQVMKVLKQYVQANGELPCPADITLADVETEFGFGIDPGTCTGAITAGDTHKGMVPVSTLNIYPSLAVDAWGNRLTYYVISTVTRNDHICTVTAGECTTPNDDGTYISFRNQADQPSASKVLVALVSHGANGFGAFSGRGGAAAKSAASATAWEQANSDTGGIIYAYPPYAGFDDIVEIWTYEQLLDADTME